MKKRATRTAALVAVGLAGCGAPKPLPHTVTELMADTVLLQGIMARCAADARAAAADVECTNARLAVDRIGAEEDSRHSVERGAAFDRQREQHRVQEDQSRRAAEHAKPGFDPYSSPVTSDKPPAPTKP